MDLPSSVLFCCDHNSVRSPMAEGLLKQHLGTKVFVQSAGINSDRDIDGFSIAVCEELGIKLAQHKVRAFEDLDELGGYLDSYDLIIALSPASKSVVSELTKNMAVDVEYWDIVDPTATGETREEKLAAYREVRDVMRDHIKRRFVIL